MGHGYLVVGEDFGYGSSRQGISTEIYRYQHRKLEPVRTIVAERYSMKSGYWVWEYNREESGDQWERFAIVMDGKRMVRVDLANHEHRAVHKALPLMEPSGMIYEVHDGPLTRMDGVAALEAFL